MASSDRFASIDEHVAQVSRLGLTALSNPSIESETTHVAGGFVRSVLTFTKDFDLAGPTSGRRDVPIPMIRLGRTTRAVIKAATFVGNVQLEIPAVTSIFGFSLGSSSSSVDDLHAPSESLLATGTDTRRIIELYTYGASGVVSFSTMYLNLVYVALAPSNGAKILKGTKLVLIWLPINT